MVGEDKAEATAIAEWSFGNARLRFVIGIISHSTRVRAPATQNYRPGLLLISAPVEFPNRPSLHPLNADVNFPA